MRILESLQVLLHVLKSSEFQSPVDGEIFPIGVLGVVGLDWALICRQLEIEIAPRSVLIFRLAYLLVLVSVLGCFFARL